MTPALTKTLLAAAAVAATLTPSLAEARGVRVSAGGHWRVSGGVSVVVGSPQPPPPPPLVACECGPQPAYPAYPEYYAPPPPQAVAMPAPPPRRPMFGIGLVASAIDINDGALEGEGGGLIGRLRLAPRWQLELQISQDRFHDNPRVDSRIGAAALIDLGRPGGLTPYLVLGVGLNVIQPFGDENQDHVDPDTLPHQAYVEAGVGLELELTRHWTISGDVRLQARQLEEREESGTARLTGPAALVPGEPEEEDAAEARVNLILYF